MAKTKIVLNQQSDLILNNAQIVQPTGIQKSDLPGLVDDLNLLNSSISTEESARISADAGLSSEISVERGRIDAILDGSSVNLDQFREVVDFVESIDLENDNALLSAVTSINSSLDAEEARAMAAEASLSSDIAAETSARIADVNAEETRAMAAEAALSTDLTNLQSYVDTTVDTAIANLTSDLSDETSRAEAAEAALQSAIEAETAARIAADSDLDSRIADIIVNTDLTSVDSFAEVVRDLTAEITRATAAEAELALDLAEEIASREAAIAEEHAHHTAAEELIASNLAAEVSRATDAEAELALDLAAEVSRATDAEAELALDLAAEVSRATSAEEVLTTDLAAEVSRATAAEEVLTTNLAAEVVRATTAEGVLQTNIDTEKARIDAILDGSTVDLDQFAEVVSFVQSIDLTNDDALLTAVTNINSEIDAEEARALAAEADLAATKLDLAGGTMSGAINMGWNGTNFNATISNAYEVQANAVNVNELGSISGVPVNVLADLDFGVVPGKTITSLPAPTNGGDATNKTYVDAGDATLQSNIDIEKGRIDAILQGSDVNLDQFAEVVTFVQSIDLSNDDALLNAVIGIEDSISDEAAERQAADSAIEDSISSLESNINSELSTLSNSLNTEIEDRISAIESVEGSITELTETLDSAIITINDSIDEVIASVAEEHAHHTAAEETLQANINVEKARIDAILEGSDVDLDQFREVVAFVESIDLENDEALMNAIIGIEDSITQETSDRESADLAIEDAISSLESTLSSNISTLTTSLDTEISDRISAIETIEDEIADLTESLDSSVLTINDTINGVVLDLEAEVTRATGAEGLLQSSINVEKARIDAILEGSDVDLDQFREVVAFVESIDLENDESLMNAVIGIENSITDESAARESADLAIEDAISSLESTLSSNISTLTTSLDTEISDRISSIEAIEDEIADLAESLDSSVLTINDTIDGIVSDLESEVTRATEAETTLQSNIDVEKGRIDAILLGSDVDLDQFSEIVSFVQSIDLTNDEALLNAVIGIENSISDEASARESADNEIEDSIASLESNLNSEISTLTSALNTEIDNRISDIASVEGSIADLSETVDTAVIEINDSIDALDAAKLNLAGGGMSGNINMGGNQISNAASIDANNIYTASVTTNELTSSNPNGILVSKNLSLDGNSIKNLAEPLNGGDATNKTYVDLMDGQLQSYVTNLIDIERNRIDVILDGSDVDLDQFAEVVSFVQSIDLTNDEALLTAVTSINTSITEEITAREDADADLQSQIDALSTSSNEALLAAIAEEHAHHTAAEEAIASDLADEIARSVNQDAVINAALSTEIARAYEAEQALDAAKLSRDGSQEMTGVLNMGGWGITSIDSIGKSDLSPILLESDLNGNNQKTIINLPAPTNSGDATNKLYVDAGDAALAADLADLQAYVDTTVDSAIATLTSDLAAETAARIADVDAEETRALAAEGVLQSNLNTEATERAAEDITLQGNIDTEAARAQAAETAIAADLATETATRIAEVAAEVTRATAAESVLTTDLAAEVTRATASETTLQSNINTEKGRIDAILLASEADKDSFAEIVTLINSVDTTNDTAFASYVLSNNAALADEILARETADNNLSDDISSEEAARIYADNVLQTNITTEVSRATAAEDALSAALSAEESSRIAGDTSLQSSLNNEITDRIAAVQSVQSALDIESNRAIAAEGLLTTDLATEVARATAAEGVLTTNLANEVSRATAAEGVLTTNLATEVSRATAAEAALAADIANIYSKKVTVVESSNGTLTTFTLNKSVRLGSEMIYVNGLLMEEGDDYTTIITSGKVSGVEFITAPLSNMKVRAYGVCGL